MSGLKPRPIKRVDPVVAVPQSVFDKTTATPAEPSPAPTLALKPAPTAAKQEASQKIQEKAKDKNKLKEKNKEKVKDKPKEKGKDKAKEKPKEKIKTKEKAKDKPKAKNKAKEKLKAFMLSHVDCVRLKAAAASSGLSETQIIREGVELWLAAHTKGTAD